MMLRRDFLAGGIATATLPVNAPTSFDARVGPDGFATVAEAIDAAPDDANRPWRIHICSGRWRERLTLAKPWIHLVGEGASSTELTYDNAAGMPAPGGRPWGTFRSASLTIIADNCALTDMTLGNGFDYLSARQNPADNPAGNGLQAVALAINGDADHTRVTRVALKGWQDTLLVNAGRSHFRECRVEGAVDFIFGGGTGFFDRCRIVSRDRGGTSGRLGYIAAPSTPAAQDYGLIFDRCTIEREQGVPDGSIALGRPWRPHPDAVPQAAYLRCWMDAHIDPEGWDRMAYARNPNGSMQWFEPKFARFFEHQSRGPGGQLAPGRRQLTDAQAAYFNRQRVLGSSA